MSNNRDYEAMNIALLLSQIFKLMPASVVKSIEVITNPEAKYDVEGAVGVLNLVMNAPQGAAKSMDMPGQTLRQLYRTTVASRNDEQH